MFKSDKREHIESQEEIKIKFRRVKLQYQINLLEVFKRMGMLSGVVHIKAILAIIQLSKEKMCLSLRKTFVRIPTVLSQSQLPNSFRYYDALISIIKNKMSNEMHDTVNFESSLNLIRDEQAKLEHGNHHTPVMLNFKNTKNIQSVQYSQFVEVEESPKEEGGSLEVNFLDQRELARRDDKLLKEKFLFAKKLMILKQKGEKLALHDRVEKRVINKIKRDYEDLFDVDNAGKIISVTPKPLFEKRVSLRQQSTIDMQLAYLRKEHQRKERGSTVTRKPERPSSSGSGQPSH